MRRYMVLFILIGFALILYAIAKASVTFIPTQDRQYNELLPETLENN